MKEEIISPDNALLQNGSPSNPTLWIFQHQEFFGMEDTDRSLTLNNLINKLNYVNFTNGHVSFLFTQNGTGAQIMIKAYPQPCVKNTLVSHLDSSDASALTDLKDYRLTNLMIDEGHTAILAPAELISLEGGVLKTSLPEVSRIKTFRKIKRFSCDDIRCKIIQGDFNATGQLIDFSSGGVGVSLDGNINTKGFDEAKSALLNINQNGAQIYYGLCRCIRSGTDSHNNKVVFIPLDDQFSLFPKRETRNSRLQVGPSFSACFHHPFFKGSIERDIFDISQAGFSIKDKIEEDVLLPGMFIPELSIVYAGIVKMKCSAQVVYRQIDQETNMIKYGLAIAKMDLESFTHLSQILGVSNDSHARISTEVEMDALWEFFFDTGFIYGEKYEYLQNQREAFKETYRKLYKDNPDIARHFVYKKNGKIYGHIAMVHAYEPSWLIHHFAARRGGGLTTGTMVIKQLIQYISSYNRLPSAGMDHVMSYYQLKNKVVDKIFGSFSRHLNDPKKSSMDVFSYMLFDKKHSASKLPDGWVIREATLRDLSKLKDYYESVSGGLLLSAMGLDVPSESLKKSFASAGFTREYRTYCLCDRDKPMAFIILNHSDIKLNLSDLLNGMKIIVIEPNILSWAMLSGAIDILSDFFTEQNIPLLLFPSDYLSLQNILIEKKYTLWILQLRHASDEYLSFIKNILKLR